MGPEADAANHEGGLRSLTLQVTVGLLVARVGLSLFLIFGVASLTLEFRLGAASFTPLVVYWLSAAMCVSSGLGAAMLRAGLAAAPIVGLQLGLDLLGVATLVYVTGATHSAFPFLYGVIAVCAGIVLGRRFALYATLLAMLVHSLLCTLLAVELLPPPLDQNPLYYVIPLGELLSRLTPVVAAMCAVGLLAMLLTRRYEDLRARLADSRLAQHTAAQRNASIMRSLQSGVITTDMHGLVSAANDAALRLLDSEAGTILGKPLRTLMPEMPAFETGTATTVRGESQARRPDGSTFPMGYTRSPLTQAGDTTTGWLVLFQDLTQILALRHKASHAERLATLGRTAAALAHEIRNPLGALQGSVELLMDPTTEEADRDQLGSIIHAEIRRVDALVGSMLEIAKPRAPEPSELKLATLVGEVAALCASDAKHQRRLTLKTAQVAEGDVRVFVDAAQARQALLNLVRNAIDAADIGSTLTLSFGDRDSAHAFFAVHNHGPEIAAEARARLFELYYSTKTHGIGIGLALVKNFADAHGGSLEVSSDATQGTCFCVVLPRAVEQPSPESGARASSPHEGRAP